MRNIKDLSCFIYHFNNVLVTTGEFYKHELNC